MPYTGNPTNSVTDRLRLKTGDRWDTFEYLSDAEYQYLIDTHGETGAYIPSLKAIIATLNSLRRERTAQEEVYDDQIWQHYHQMLEDAFNPRKGDISVGAPIIGGIYRDKIKANRQDPNTVGFELYEGWSTDKCFESRMYRERHYG